MSLANRALPIVAGLSCLFQLSVPVAHAGDPVKLALSFREGQVLKYSYHETMTYTPPTKFAGSVPVTIETKVDYNLKVNQVSPEDHVATVKLGFDRITVLKDGTQIADLTVFPKQGDGVAATIKPNGETTCYKNVYLAYNKGGHLEYRVSTGGGPIATGTTSSNGSENYSLAADLDEGEGVIKIGLPPTRTMDSPEYAKLAEFKIDLTPRKLFEFLTLPTVPLADGQTFSVPIKYLGQEKLTYRGKADEAGYDGNLVELDITPWTESTTSATGMQPVINGSFSYLIDTTGKLIRARGTLHDQIVVPDIGPQTADTKMELLIRK